MKYLNIPYLNPHDLELESPQSVQCHKANNVCLFMSAATSKAGKPLICLGSSESLIEPYTDVEHPCEFHVKKKHDRLFKAPDCAMCMHMCLSVNHFFIVRIQVCHVFNVMFTDSIYSAGPRVTFKCFIFRYIYIVPLFVYLYYFILPYTSADCIHCHGIAPSTELKERCPVCTPCFQCRLNPKGVCSAGIQGCLNPWLLWNELTPALTQAIR